MRGKTYNVELQRLGRREANNTLERTQNKMRRRGRLLQVIATVCYGSAEDRVKCAMHKLIDKVFRDVSLVPRIMQVEEQDWRVKQLHDKQLSLPRGPSA